MVKIRFLFVGASWASILKPIFHYDAKNTWVWPSRWAIPPMREFCDGHTNMLVSKNANISITPNKNTEICVTPNANPLSEHVEYRSRWSPTQNSHFGHVDFMLFVLISFALGNQQEPSLQWNMGFRYLRVLIQIILLISMF